VRIGKVPRLLLGSVTASLVTGLLLGAALVQWPDLWPGWLVVAGFTAFGVLWNIADVAIDVADGRLRRVTDDHFGPPCAGGDP
jgi:hypothetical protein